MRPVFRTYLFLGIGVALFISSILFFSWSIGYMQHAMIATSLLSALIGFSLLSGALYVFRLSAYVYGVERGEGKAVGEGAEG